MLTNSCEADLQTTRTKVRGNNKKKILTKISDFTDFASSLRLKDLV